MQLPNGHVVVRVNSGSVYQQPQHAQVNWALCLPGHALAVFSMGHLWAMWHSWFSYLTFENDFSKPLFVNIFLKFGFSNNF